MPDAHSKEQLETRVLSITATKQGIYWFCVEWSNKRLYKWVRKLFPQAFSWLDAFYGVPKEPEHRWTLLNSYWNRLQKDHEMLISMDMNISKGAVKIGL
jgi:hypothetical protein